LRTLASRACFLDEPATAVTAMKQQSAVHHRDLHCCKSIEGHRRGASTLPRRARGQTYFFMQSDVSTVKPPHETLVGVTVTWPELTPQPAKPIGGVCGSASAVPVRASDAATAAVTKVNRFLILLPIRFRSAGVTVDAGPHGRIPLMRCGLGSLEQANLVRRSPRHRARTRVTPTHGYFAGVDRERTLESRDLPSPHMSGDRIVAGNRLARSCAGSREFGLLNGSLSAGSPKSQPRRPRF
jgi:hypothetical protein